MSLFFHLMLSMCYVMGVMLNMILIAIALFARFQNECIIDLVCLIPTTCSSNLLAFIRSKAFQICIVVRLCFIIRLSSGGCEMCIRVVCQYMILCGSLIVEGVYRRRFKASMRFGEISFSDGICRLYKYIELFNFALASGGMIIRQQTDVNVQRPLFCCN